MSKVPPDRPRITTVARLRALSLLVGAQPVSDRLTQTTATVYVDAAAALIECDRADEAARALLSIAAGSERANVATAALLAGLHEQPNG